jgi:hypothetical protein
MRKGTEIFTATTAVVIIIIIIIIIIQVEVMTNRPNITVTNIEAKTCVLQNVAIQADRKVTQWETKENNFTSLRAEIQRMWNMRRIVKPAITRATRAVTKGLKKHLEAIKGDIQ